MDTYLARQRILIARRNREAEERRERARRLAEFRKSRPRDQHRLSPSEFDPTTGYVAWPDILLTDTYAKDRKRLEELLVLQRYTRGKPEIGVELVQVIDRMYERLGDPVAYNVVRDHFEILFAAIEQRGGTVIKTIGDAVMGSFVNNHDAVQSVLDAFEQFRRYNIDHLVERHVHIKAGIHRGPAILVNLDGRLDYFGSTINRAARLQGHARADQILLTQSVHADPDVQAALAAAGLSDPVESLVDMKGIDGRQTVYRWQYGPSPDTASGAHEGLVARLFRLWR